MKSGLASLLGAALALALAGSSRAELLFQSVPDLAARPDVVALCSGCNGKYQAYAGFQLANDSYLTTVELAVRAYAGSGNFVDGPFEVQIYDGAPAVAGGQLLFSNTIFGFNSGHDPADELIGAPVVTPFESAVVSFTTPSLLLLRDHAYTISFVQSDFHLPVFRDGASPLYTDGGVLYPEIARSPFVYELNNGTQVSSGSLGFRLAGDISTAVPEPESWALLISGFGLAGGVLRRRRAVVA
jgi:hypothetical protein